VDFTDIIYDISDGVARITLNRPDKLNALSWYSLAEVEAAMALASDDDDVRCVVITGAGRGFSAGFDLTMRTDDIAPARRPYKGRALTERTRFLTAASVYRCPKPTIAAVNGACVGVGLSIALSCDMRIASEAARFGALFVKRALVADNGATWLLPRIVGPEHAMRMLFTGRMVNADEALTMGLVGEVVPADQLEAKAAALAHDVAHGPSVIVELVKRLVREAEHAELEPHTEREEFYQQIGRGTEDFTEGIKSFAERREPRFIGR
jgi:2-(1,2-epoxy-1,2-dihydrophenyl)acetyl-CoA isomerase